MKKIITRFPPSPTGYLHVGGARTALFNWLYARHTNGKFVLRIEDTDLQRSTQESVDAIFEAMEWLNIDWDEGPFYQSQRFDIYKTYVQQLIDSGHAYYCSCTAEQVDEMRKKGMAANGKAKYDGTCREKGLAKGNNTAVRFKVPYAGTTIIEDKVKGNIVFQNSDLDDFVICRSDGVPTYNFVVVIDDMTMGINTIIRGDDHVSNTPKQILLYKALGAELPVFAHVPMVLGRDKTRLSKRHGAMSVTEYRKMGFLPDALINYLVRLGWSYGDQEYFTRDELVEKFTLDHIGKSAGVFDPDKLLALNADHIKASEPEKLIPHLQPFLDEKGIDYQDTDYLVKVIKTLNARSKTLIEMAESAMFYYQDTIVYEETAAKKNLKPNALDPLNGLIQELEALDEFTEKNLEGAFLAVMEKTGLKLGKIAQPVRVALTGKTASPGIFEIIEILGKDAALSRLKACVKYIAEKN
ncbi:Glutamate--tRNA ligase [Desulfonema limicola]|uniref:Glutamate--tRNA ligase n=1 Tax=Desulfonema limicola TaxID=45656 RepID=A0A975B9E5_9BACT|nr:glutamate--tRNA ligase [Desulfonema limicola]QTA81174.1 Glutamate--tRNA ligase [Desulfonema limicola]